MTVTSLLERKMQNVCRLLRMLFPQIDGLADGESADYYKGLLQRYYYYPIRDRSIRDRSLDGVCMFYAAWSRKTLSNFVLPALNCAEGRRRVLITIDTWRDFLGSKKSNSDEEILDAKTIMLDILAQQNRAEIHSRLKF